MKEKHKKKIYFIISVIIISIIFVSISPEIEESKTAFYSLLLFVPGLIFLIKWQRKYTNNDNTFLFSKIFFSFFLLYVYVGNLNFLIIKSFYPLYKGDLLRTNIYILISFYFIIIGYMLTIKKNVDKYYVYRLLNMKKTIKVFFMLGTLGTLLIIISEGGIGILTADRIGVQRFTGDMDLRAARLYYMLIFSSLFSFKQLITIKEDHKYYKAILFFSFIQLPITAQRFPIVLVVVGCILIYVCYKKIKRKHFLVGLLILLGLFVFNSLIYKIRMQDDSPYEKFFVDGSDFRSTLYKDIIPFTFNEYNQLVNMMEIFNDYRYGTTLINIPISFIPYFFLEPFGIIKKDIRLDNSAYILQMMISRKGEGTGIRTGLSGEFYLNFGFFGCFFYFFIGIILAKLDNKRNSLLKLDFRLIFLVLYMIILIYSLIGQIDAIGGTWFSIFFVSFILSRFSQQEEIRDENIK
ncbi:MAG: O-antigen polysaccharide polymerase Wzy [Candidatus Lokiarchaeota archaeon]|nr:O-antigen polysaccharide polymerase Wzy [Candidatus Lokiarchaeota archaeon]